MILLVGEGNDPPLQAVGAALQEIGANYLLISGDLELVRPWQARSEAVLSAGSRVIPLQKVKSAYLRPLGMPTDGNGDRGALAALFAWADFSTARIVNRPHASLTNNSKPLQAQLIRRLRLRVPETLVTTDPSAAREFALRHGEVIYKSTSGVRSVVRRLAAERYSLLENVANCPTQFQQYIPGHDVRVHVIGDLVHALEIISNRDDYRYAASSGGHIQVREIELDPAVASLLRAMVKNMGLWIAGVDLRRTPAGELYCLEVNPSPGVTYYEQLAGVQLAKYIAALLAST